MISRSPRPRLHPGRHRKLPAVTESQMPPVTPASLPQPDLRASMPLQSFAVATPVPAEPEPEVQCGWCKVIGPLSQIPGSHGWYRCAKVWECIPRQLASGLPSALAPAAEALEPLPAAGPEPGSSTSLTSGNVIRDSRNSRSEGGPEIQPDAVVDQEPLPVLPPAQEEALAAFEQAHAEQAAAEGKERSEDEEPGEADESAVATAEAGEPVPEPHEDTAPGDGAQGGDYT